jgi:hypothetical protein
MTSLEVGVFIESHDPGMIQKMLCDAVMALHVSRTQGNQAHEPAEREVQKQR